jgi:hypothetical protein
MLDAAIRQELLEALSELSVPLQHQVLIYARSLTKSGVRGTPGKRLLKFAGTMSPSEGDDFLRGIEEDCERVDPNDW